MKTEQLFIENTPAVLYGEPSDTLWLFIHGQFGCKEEALPFAEIVSPDAQVLSIDLPNHGTRQNRDEEFAPWTAAPELTRVMAYTRAHWRATNVRATSIGAYFARLAFAAPEKALFVSPIVDMERLICDRICAAHYRANPARARHVSCKGRRYALVGLPLLGACASGKGLVLPAVHSLRRK